MRSPHEPTGGVLPSLSIDCGRERERERAARAGHRESAPGGAAPPALRRGLAGALDPGGSAVGFHVLPPLQEARLVELTRSESSSPVAAARAERFFAALGKHCEWVGDAPGLVLGRIVCQVINESRVRARRGRRQRARHRHRHVLGLSHPRGPLAWADAIGLDHVLAVLEALCEEYREERYRPAPALRAAGGRGPRSGAPAKAGFFDYDDEG